MKNVSASIHESYSFPLIDNDNAPFRAKWKNAYGDIPYARRDCDLASRFFQREYNVLEEDIYEISNTTFRETKRKFKEFEDMLKATVGKNKVLCIHVYAGHGVLFRGMQSLLLNEFD